MTRVSPSPDRNATGPVSIRGRASFRHWAPLLLPIALTASLAGCAPTADVQGMPADVVSAPRVVREAYTFAVAQPEVLTQLPCYCGCGAIGHTSNYACYVSGSDADGAIAFDLHATGCSICVDITRDAMRMLDAGRTVPQIRTEIDRTYAAFGSSNMP